MRFRAYSTVRYWPICQSNAQYDEQVLITSAVEEIQSSDFADPRDSEVPVRRVLLCLGHPQTGRNSDHNCCFLTGSKTASKVNIQPSEIWLFVFFSFYCKSNTTSAAKSSSYGVHLYTKI